MLQVVATVALEQARAPVPQAKQVVPEVKYPADEHEVEQAAVELAQTKQTPLVAANPVEHEVA